MSIFSKISLTKLYNNRKLQFDILSSFFTLQLITALSIAYYTYTNNKKSLVDFSDKLIENISAEAIEHIGDRFHDVRVCVELGSFIIKDHDKVDVTNSTLVSYMLGFVRQFNYVESIFIGTESGRFFQIKKLEPNSTYRSSTNKLLPQKAIYALRVVDRDKLRAYEKWNYLDIDGKVLETESLPEFQVSFDHKIRPWYTKTMQTRDIFWTDIYIFSTTSEPGVACSYPIKNDQGECIGVIGTDVPLKSIADILKYNVLKGTSLIINQKGDVIAHPTEKETSKVIGGEAKLITLDDLVDKTPSTAYRLYLQNKNLNRLLFTNSSGEEYIATFKKFVSDQFKGWTFVVITPTDVFIGGIKATQRTTLIICLVILIISTFLIACIAKRVATPINILSYQADLITNFNLEPTPEVTSNIREIQDLQSAISRMRKSLASFGKFVPKNLVRKLIERGTEVKVGGKTKKLTIFFSDIESFTSISENFPSERLVQHLSEYFEEMSMIVNQENGTIDKYIGDAIMAFWGAPQNDKDHSLHACKTALLCQKRLADLNRKWVFEKKPALNTRIGIHCGDVIVGNIGSSERLNYTIIGDSVNLAARLEGTNKMYHTYITISEDVLHNIVDYAVVRPLDIVAVKGKDLGIKIYELVALKNSDPLVLPSDHQINFCKNFTRAFTLYLDKRWDEASAFFASIIEEFGPDYTSNMYIQRCQAFKETPPPADWDGVFHLNAK